MNDDVAQEKKSEKLVMGPDEFAGLELAPQARSDGAEKEHVAIDGLQVAGSNAYKYGASGEGDHTTMKETFAQQRMDNPKEKSSSLGRHCKVRRIIILAVFAILVILAAVLGGVLGSRSAASRSASSLQAPSQTSTSASPLSSSAQPAAPSIINGNLPKTDIMVASPLVPLTFLAEESPDIESYSLFYQSAAGTTKLTGRDGLNGSWNPASDIFTDSMNGTGIAALSYPNGTAPQSTLLYVGSSNARIREKRQDPSGYWNLGPLTRMHVPVSGNSSTSGGSDWNKLRLAAVYSANFSSGPGARLFLHQNNDTASWVQELIWMQANDSWVYGSQISGPQAGSHLSVVIEPQSQSLRLFYSTSDNAVQEAWCNITSQNPFYQPGVSLPTLLRHQYDDFSVVSTPDSTLLYYSSSLAQNSNITIRELALPLLPNTSVSSSSVLVAEPALQATDSEGRNASDFVPLAAIAAPQGNVITVFYPEDAVDPESGYGRLQSIWRMANGSWGDVSYGQAQNMIPINLGNTA